MSECVYIEIYMDVINANVYRFVCLCTHCAMGDNGRVFWCHLCCREKKQVDAEHGHAPGPFWTAFDTDYDVMGNKAVKDSVILYQCWVCTKAVDEADAQFEVELNRALQVSMADNTESAFGGNDGDVDQELARAIELSMAADAGATAADVEDDGALALVLALSLTDLSEK